MNIRKIHLQKNGLEKGNSFQKWFLGIHVKISGKGFIVVFKAGCSENTRVHVLTKDFLRRHDAGPATM